MKLYYNKEKVNGVYLFETNEYIKLDKYKTVKGCIKHAKITNSKGEVLTIPENVEVVDVEKVWKIKSNLKKANSQDYQYLLFSVLSIEERLRQAYCPVILSFMLCDMLEGIKSELVANGEYKQLNKKLLNDMIEKANAVKSKVRTVMPKDLIDDLIKTKDELNSTLSMNLFMLKIQMKNEALRVAPNFKLNDVIVSCEIVRLFCMFINGQDELFDQMVSNRLGIKYGGYKNEEVERMRILTKQLMEHLVKGLNVTFRFDGQEVAGVNSMQLAFDSLVLKINKLKWTQFIK